MKNLRKIVIAVVFIMSFCFGYSYNFEFEIEPNECESCLNHSQELCNNGLGDFENLEFASLYKYNSNNFSSCDLNGLNSQVNIEHKINNKIEELEAHENHLHYMTYTIKKQHKNLITTNTKAAFNYVIVLDTSSTHHQEIIDYGIKFKL